MIYTSFRCVLKMSLSFIKIRSHLFWKACTCMSDLRESINIGIQLCIRFIAQRKKKENTWENTPNTCFLKNKLCWNYFVEMYFNEIFVRIEADQHERTSCLLHKIAGKRHRLLQQQTNKRQLSMKYQQQYVRSRRKASKTIANRLYLDLLCVFSALVNSATGTRLHI